jgi:hypothetical protein
MKTRISVPQGMAYGWWHFAFPFIDDLMFDVELLSGDEQTPGRYYQLYQGQISGVGAYFGFQTNLWLPDMGWQGKGLLFSRWGSRNDDDASAAEGGWVENAGHEGDFVGVRSKFDWRLGHYRCWLLPTSKETGAKWYEFRVLCLDDGREASAGNLRFPSRSGQEGLIHSGGGSWTEVYSHASFAEDVPLSHMVIHGITANDGTARPIRCDTTYNSKFPYADAFVSKDGALNLISGQGVSKAHPSQSYVINS